MGRCLSKPHTLLINYYTPGMLITGAVSAFRRAPGREEKDIQFLITRTPGVARSRLENDDVNHAKNTRARRAARLLIAFRASYN